MSARDDMILALVMAGQPIRLAEGIVDPIIRDHAHELAEKIRSYGDDIREAAWLADQIDPEV